MGDESGMRMEFAALLQRDQVAALLAVDQQHPVADGEMTTHVVVLCGVGPSSTGTDVG